MFFTGEAQAGETYLGDGLYAVVEDVTVIIRTSRHNGDHYVVLDPETFDALVAFWGRAFPSAD